MAIRFQCASCQQPIEVDDEHAQRLVACPYCRKTVTAPAESTLPEPHEIPLASPLHGAPGGMMPPNSMPRLGPPAKKNTLALVAFGLACGLMVCFAILFAVVKQHSLELEELEKSVSASPSMAEQWQAMMQFIERQGGNVPPWLVLMGMAQLGALALWLAALICGIIAVRHSYRRGFAAAALVICGLPLVLFCLGI